VYQPWWLPKNRLLLDSVLNLGPRSVSYSIFYFLASHILAECKNQHKSKIEDGSEIRLKKKKKKNTRWEINKFEIADTKVSGF
jgi:hypothetical protein